METPLTRYVFNKRLHILVKSNAKKNDVLGFDAAKGAVRIAIAAPADKNKANKELLRFVAKQLGKRVSFVSGLKSREKILEIHE